VKLGPKSHLLHLRADMLARELARHAPEGVDAWTWARDRAAHLVVLDGECTVGDVVACLARGTDRTGRTRNDLPVSPLALGVVCRGVEVV
jgi:hypothetical protein